MSFFLNRTLLEQTSFDSAVPSGTAILVHRFEREGDFIVAVARGDEIVPRLRLSVSPAPAAGPETSEPANRGRETSPVPAAVTVDLAAGDQDQDRPLTVRAGDFVAFTAATRPASRRIVISRADDAPGEEELDSNRAGPGDVFAVTLIRPGRYLATDTVSGASVEVRVTYPVIGSTPYRPADPAVVQCRQDGFSAQSLTLGPAQGLVFDLQAHCRIQVELVEPDDGPSGEPAPRQRWARPRSADADDTAGR